MAGPTTPQRGRSFDPAQTYQQAILLDRQGRVQEAEALCRKLLAALPNSFEVLHLLCHVCQRAGHVEDAVTFGRKALNQRPGSVDAMLTLGNALALLGRVDEAMARYEKALALDPRHFATLNNLGNILKSECRFEEAAAYYEKAIAIQGDRTGPENNLASCLLALQRPAEAIEHYRRAQTLDPDFAVAHYNEGTARLAAGDYPEGWRKYEWRWSVPDFQTSQRKNAPTRWRGDADISGKTILLWAEQGLGDTIEFARYAPLVAARGARVILEVQPALLSVMATLAGPAELRRQGDEPGSFDFHCPLLSLPLAFGTTLETIPNRIPYLSADAAKAERWLERLEKLPGRRVGLVWFGSSQLGFSAINNVDRRRSIALAQLAPLAAIGGVSFVSLQLGKPAWGGGPAPRELLVHDWTAEIKDFSDTAALIAGLDLVISVDTSVAHLAGALGKPIWLLNRFDTCWRWLLDRDDSPWYPSLRQFRQLKPGDWNAVVASLRDALAAWSAGAGQPA